MPAHPVRSEIRLLDGHFYANDPHLHFAWMREHAPVYWDESSGLWGIALHRDVMELSKDARTFSSAGGSRPDSPPIPSMINLDDPNHKRRRNLVNRGFTKGRIQAEESKVREICVELVERARAKIEFDFVREVAAPLPMIVIGDMLGVAPEDRDDLLRWSDDLIRGTSASATPEAQAGAMRAFGEYSEYHRRIVADRRANPPRPDLMSVLVHAEIDGEKLDDDALLQESLLILVGGDETTRHVISGGMYQLLRHRRGAGEARSPAGASRARRRRDAALGDTDSEHESHCDARRRVAGSEATRGGQAPPALPVREPRRKRIPGAVSIRRRARPQRSRCLRRLRRALLSRGKLGAPRTARHVRGDPPSPAPRLNLRATRHRS